MRLTWKEGEATVLTAGVVAEDVPDLVELRWRSHLMLGRSTDSFGLVGGVRVGVSV